MLWKGSGRMSGVRGRCCIKHFSNISDRNIHPIPFVASGPGTGKTRSLEELGDMLQNLALKDDDPKVREMFENMISIIITVARYAIWRVLEKCRQLGVSKGILRLDTILNVINISQQKSQYHIMLIFLLCVDETNKLIENDTSPTSQTFRAVVNAVGHISCGKIVKNIFFIPILAGTLEVLLREIITKSMHPALSLPLPLLSHDDTVSISYKDVGLNEVYVKTTNVLQCCISDIGGHARALDIFLEKCADTENVESINLYDIMQFVHVELLKLYDFVKISTEMAPEVAHAILGIPITPETNIAENSKITYMDLALMVESQMGTAFGNIDYSKVSFCLARLEGFQFPFWAFKLHLYTVMGYTDVLLSEFLKDKKDDKKSQGLAFITTTIPFDIFLLCIFIRKRLEYFILQSQVKNVAIIYHDNFHQFYGPIYASRAQFVADCLPWLAIASNSWRGPTIANKILGRRKERPFENEDDLLKHVKFPKTQLSQIQF
ncbi:18642_t:CDS:2 [Entrophospora sp. SA101]|nr:18642_t:CDS:2 [Entrophospora sp. SA101]